MGMLDNMLTKGLIQRETAAAFGLAVGDAKPQVRRILELNPILGNERLDVFEGGRAVEALLTQQLQELCLVHNGTPCIQATSVGRT